MRVNLYRQHENKRRANYGCYAPNIAVGNPFPQAHEINTERDSSDFSQSQSIFTNALIRCKLNGRANGCECNLHSK